MSTIPAIQREVGPSRHHQQTLNPYRSSKQIRARKQSMDKSSIRKHEYIYKFWEIMWEGRNEGCKLKVKYLITRRGTKRTPSEAEQNARE
jgi:hypothetical protein